MRSECFLAVLAAACAQPEVPHNAPAQRPATLEHRTAPAPSIAPRVWRVQILTWGGFSGFGKGGILFDSGQSTFGPCKAALPETDRLAVENAVAAARSEGWLPSYRHDAWSGLTDQFVYTLSLTFEDDTGATVARSASWQTDSVDLLPADLRRLQDALWAAHEHGKQICAETRSLR